MESIIKEVSEQFSKGNFEFTYPYMDDHIKWNVVGAPAIVNKEAIIDYCNKMLVEMKDSTLYTTHYIMNDNAIAVQGYCDYTREDNTPGKVEFCDIYRFKNEKLEEITSYVIEIKNISK